MIRLKLIICTTILSLLLLPLAAQHRERIAFFNTENLFDTINDPSTDDEQMLPLSDLEWDGTKYHHKVECIAKLILEMQCPAIMGFAEVENRGVLEDVVRCRALEGMGYEICHYDSPDKRGIDVAMIYRKEVFRLADSRPIRTDIEGRTRDLLLVNGEMYGKPLSIIVVHWPSRIGGVKFTEHLRIACALQTKELADSLMQSDNRRGVIIMGDMNDNPNDRSIKEILCANDKREKNLSTEICSRSLYNPFARLHKLRRGTTVYQKRWNMYDNIIVSEDITLGADDAQQKPKSAATRRMGLGYIFRHEMLLDKTDCPRPTYIGADYVGGISDHLPIFIVVEL